jgi:hypothetical protein
MWTVDLVWVTTSDDSDAEACGVAAPYSSIHAPA